MTDSLPANAAQTQRTLVNALAATLREHYGELAHIETHISHILLAGAQAWKIKKPVNFGFLDFTTLEKRRHYCEEELRLNRRLAPSLYEAVEPITGPLDAPQIGGEGEALDYAVRMRRFPNSAQLDRQLAAGGLPLELMDRIAEKIARFHHDAEPAPADSRFGTPDTVYAPMAQNFEQIGAMLPDESERARLNRLEHWTATRFDALRPLLAQRKADGHIRACHGDMHLANMALLDGELIIFDGIEFNEDFRLIDTLNDLAFLVMDLDDRGLTAHARRLLNSYIEHSGDHAGLPLLDFYTVYRALVRAKVALFELGNPTLDLPAREAILARYRRYARLAERIIDTERRPSLCLTLGVSGSGKSVIAEKLVEALGALRLRSDVERQRLFGREEKSGGLETGIYTPEATEATYARLRELTQTLLAAGFPVVVDATFLKAAQRAPFTALADERRCPWLILDIDCDTATLEARVRARRDEGRDPSQADSDVLHHQLATREALDDTERRHRYPLRCDALPDGQVAGIVELLGR